MKPIVFYSGEPEFHSSKEGPYAVVFALNHPRLGQQVVRTSLVSSSDVNGFETLNTRYQKNTWPFPSLTKITDGRSKGELYCCGVGVGKQTVQAKPFNPDDFEEALI